MTNEIQEYVKFKNTLKLMFAPLTQKQRDLVMIWFAGIRDRGLSKVTISYDEIIEKGQFGEIGTARLYSMMEETSELLTNIVSRFAMTYEDGKRYSAKFALFPTWINNEERKEITLSMNKDFEEFFNDFTNGNWTSFELLEYISLNSKYTKDIYLLLKQWKTIGHCEVSIDTMKEDFGVPESYSANKIKEKIVSKAVEELKPFFEDLKLKEINAKNSGVGRPPVIGYSFDFTPQKYDGLTVEEKQLRAIEKSGGKASGLKCPRCGKPLMKKIINGNNCWCHYDWKTGSCNAIFSAVSDIRKEWRLKEEQKEAEMELTEEQKENRRKIEEIIDKTVSHFTI